MKKKEIDKKRTSSFDINSENKEEKINEKKNKEENLVSLANNSNIFSELQMDTTNSNFNNTKCEEDVFKDKDNENKISKKNTNNNTNNTNNTNIKIINNLQNNINKENKNCNNSEINFSISHETQNINIQKTTEIEFLQKEFNNTENDINIIVSNLNKNITESNDNNIDSFIGQILPLYSDM